MYSIHRYVVYTVLLLGLYFRSTHGQDGCITFQQVGVSVLHGETKLVCGVTDSADNFFMRWVIDGRTVHATAIERRQGRVTALDPCPKQYHCVWDEKKSSFVITINNTTERDSGHWTCDYRVEDGCFEDLSVDVTLVGMIF